MNNISFLGSRTWLFFLLLLVTLSVRAEDDEERSKIQVSPSSVTMAAGSTAVLAVSEAQGRISVESHEESVIRARYDDGSVKLTALKSGKTTVTVKDKESSREIPVRVLDSSNPPPISESDYTLLAWNDLGMHCVDGKDYSIFSILPPYNNLNAQLKDKNGGLVSENVVLTYQATEDTQGSINTYSDSKTNFWDYVLSLFGAEPEPNHGLNLNDPSISNPTPSLIAAPMQYNGTHSWFQAGGIPIMPYPDTTFEQGTGEKNFYPMVEVVAKDLTGKVLASTKTVLPVSDEITCQACHSSSSGNAARPADGWVNDSDPEKDWKRNILKRHDDDLSSTLYQSALNDMGYLNTGLLASADSGQPALCAGCHASNALATTGYPGVKPLTQSLHADHAQVLDPNTNMTLNNSDNRAACYLCHPGAVTQCLRGAMGKATDSNGDSLMSCQSCHGNMEQVGNEGWLDEPTCQSCHHDGIRETVAIDNQGLPLQWSDTTFASNPDTPIPGKDLYRFSTGHGGFQCEACHGATHAIYPSLDANDNVQSIAVQGHSGTVNECEACHTQVPLTTNGGPHGMHTTGEQWVSAHEDVVEDDGSEACTYCHGSDYRGTPLSEVKMDKTFRVEEESRSFSAGDLSVQDTKWAVMTVMMVPVRRKVIVHFPL